MALDRFIRKSFRNAEEIAESIPGLEPTLREDARALAQGSLTKACELYGQSRSQTNVLRYSGAETVRSREVLVLEAEANVTNEQYDLAKA
eukprot:CAMPEP_0182583938 /NCGR_PEP_ID=MMETSP1324-20130603/56552_1 /TAXON_ID=236786 /ORGANISM="Florenciella sp., Strain RCC1587" /LENGTH=89 /DNA_ID=CAMNT_0024800547 /DNA_START=39 /DNA_END=304 /DNA_ORIENTATION=-